MIDIEADGPIPGDYSMVSFAAVIVKPALTKTFFAELKPISSNWEPENLKVTGYSREQTLQFPDPLAEMLRFYDWVLENTSKKPRFIADNGFDWMFMAWYFYHFLGKNPFGFSPWNLSSLFKGLSKRSFKNFSHLRKTPHTHHPLDDAMGNAQAMLAMIELYDMKIRL